MKNVHRNLVLARVGDADAQAALFSLPLPEGQGRKLALAYSCAGMQPLSWWKPDEEPRRVLAALAAAPDTELPSSLQIKAGKSKAMAEDAPSPWRLSTPLTTERLPYVPHKFSDIDSLRGVPAADCTTMEYALDLSFGGRTLRLQPGATGPGTAECLWQNVQVERLWRNEAAEAVRVGGVIYNEDTYLWADMYLVLFANGVVSATLHFTNTRLHIKGYDFRGLPYLKIQGDGLQSTEAVLPRDGWRFDVGAARFNFAGTAITCSEEQPASLQSRDDAVYYTPFASIINPQHTERPDDYWEPGFARTIRLEFSLSAAPPAVARYVIPAWWYGVCGEPWAGNVLPAHGHFDAMAGATARHIQTSMRRGAFDGGTDPDSNFGETGAGLMQQAYLSGEESLYRDALDYCTYWADLAVDHTDYTVHQWLGGWGWKTCAYTKFRDVLYAWLETGDPWMYDTMEMVADVYWAWFRSNWPRNAIGRDAYDVSAWAWLWRYLNNDSARIRLQKFVHMMQTVVETQGVIGGQMGAGPHPGWHPSLYMTGVAMVSLIEAIEAAQEVGKPLNSLLPTLETMHRHYIRDDVELFPSNLGAARKAGWGSSQATFGMRIYSVIARRFGADEPVVQEGFSRIRPWLEKDVTDRKNWGRLGDQLVHPSSHDALMLGARVAADGQGIDIAPVFGDKTLPWPERQTVETPWGLLTIAAKATARGVELTLCAPADFRVRIESAGAVLETRSCGEVQLRLAR